MLEMLEHPDRYDWIEVEADDVGALDDVLAMQRDGVLVAKQVKFSAHPDSTDDPYSWDNLLAEGEGKRGKTPSLLKKWSAGPRGNGWRAWPPSVSLYSATHGIEVPNFLGWTKSAMPFPTHHCCPGLCCAT
jgi:hypothetical protein